MGKEKGKIDFLLFGYNGVNNTGSEAKLITTILDLKKVVGERLGEITVLTQSIENQRRYVPDPAIKLIKITPATLINPLEIIRHKSDILLLSEGSTFIDHFSSIFCWMFCGAARIAKLRGQAVVAYSNDCGHLKPFNQRIVRDTINKSVDLVMLRNPDAIARMREYGVTKEIHLVADGAYSYPTPSAEYIANVWKKLSLEPDKRPVIGMCPKEFFWWPVKIKFIGAKEDLYNWPAYNTWTKEGRENSKIYVEQSARYADWCVEKFNADIALISMEHMDFPATRKIYEAMKHKERARLVPSDDYIVDDIVAVLSACKFQVTTRYHSTVLASPFGVPMMSVSSDTRCEAVFRELNMMDYYLDYVKHPNRFPNLKELDEWLIDKTNKLVEEEAELKKRILDAHKEFVARTDKMRAIFKNWLENEFLPKAKI